MGLITFPLRHPISMVILILGVTLANLFAIQRMPRDIFPDLGYPFSKWRSPMPAALISALI
jgi:multidrug efflux pump subunit AcrB